jgi:predicted DNA-binding transcriptional regulator AlpA
MSHEGHIAAEVEHVACASCGERRAATRVGLSVCVICAGIVPAPDIVDINGVAEILGVSRQTAYSMKAAGKLPPCTKVRSGSIWWREAIEAVAKKRKAP